MVSISDVTAVEVHASKPLPPLWDVWTHGGQGVGWWLYERGYDNAEDAAASAAEKLHSTDVVAVCILPTGLVPSADRPPKTTR